jgi:nicotinamide-nucleotide amidase
MFPEDIQTLARQVIETAAARGLTLATAESCTGGLVAGALTGIAGSSAVVERGFVTYSNPAKTDLLGVSARLIETHGAVSEPVARAMAAGALARSLASVSVSVTGIAGPGGGTADKPVGLVHFSAVGPDGEFHAMHRFGDIGREQVRRGQAVAPVGLEPASVDGASGDQSLAGLDDGQSQHLVHVRADRHLGVGHLLGEGQALRHCRV